jgi:hypothetical protein
MKDGRSRAGRRVTLTRERTPETADHWYYTVTYWGPRKVLRYTPFDHEELSRDVHDRTRPEQWRPCSERCSMCSSNAS